MTLTLNNTHDYQPHSLMPKESFIDKELDLRFDKLKTKAGEEISIANVMIEIVKICALLQVQARSMHRTSTNNMHPKILEETEIQASSYCSRIVWTLAAAGGLAAVCAAGYGAYEMTHIINNNSAEIAGNLLQPLAKELAGFEAVSSGLNMFSNLEKERQQGPRDLRNHLIERMKLLRDQLNEAGRGAEGKLAEAERTLRELISALHQIAYTLFHNQ